MNIHIVNEPCKTIRTIARQALKGNWLKMAFIVGLYIAFTSGITSLITIFTAKPVDLSYLGIETTVMYNYSFFSELYGTIISGPFAVGIAAVSVNYLRYRKAETGELFVGFEKFFKSLWLYVLMVLKIFVWALLFVIPGIIAAIRYSQAFYIHRDHPEFTALECIKESSRIMTGNKSKFFLLSLSFIGWLILANIPNSILSIMVKNDILLAGTFMYYVLVVICYIPLFFVIAYMNISHAAFYDLLTERLVPSRPEDRMAQNNDYQMN